MPTPRIQHLACICIALWAMAGCGSERSIELALEYRGARSDLVCLSVFGAGNIAYQDRLPGEEAVGTLAFVEGSDVRDEARFLAIARRGGRAVARSASSGRFAPPGESRVTLAAARCLPRRETPMAERVGVLDGASRLAVADTNGDGREELWGHGAGIAQLDGSTLEGERVVYVADFDEDCLDDVAVVRGDSLVAITAQGDLPIDAADATVAAGHINGPHLALGDGTGLRWRSAAGERQLSSAPVRSLVLADLNHDGLDEILIAREGGIDAFFGSESGPLGVTGATPSGWAPEQIAVGDVDGDGHLDLVGVEAERLRVARNRGDGLLEARPAPDAIATRLRVLDLNGDCADDVVVFDGSNAQVLFGGEDARLRAGPALAGVIDAAAADDDGDGVRDAWVLRTDGAVERLAL